MDTKNYLCYIIKSKTNIMKTLSALLATKVQAYKNCIVSGNNEWEEKHLENIEELCSKYLPSGSGIDAGMGIVIASCAPEKLVFTFSYHHLNENGYYDGWTNHKLTVTPSFTGIDMKISGRDSNGIKEYLYELFHSTFTQEIN
jgi:hypothetical protein